MDSLAALLDASTDDAYRTSRGLWPVEHDPAMPGPSLDDLARRIAKDTGIDVRLEMRRHCGRCTNPNMRTLYRIAQEALTNAAKHAQAHTIRVRLRCPAQDGVILTVRDDGIGRTASARQGARTGGARPRHHGPPCRCHPCQADDRGRTAGWYHRHLRSPVRQACVPQCHKENSPRCFPLTRPLPTPIFVSCS